MSRLTLEDIERGIAADDEGFDRMLSDLGITKKELYDAGVVAVSRALFAFDQATEKPKLTELMAGIWGNGAIVGILYGRRKENIEWLAHESKEK